MFGRLLSLSLLLIVGVSPLFAEEKRLRDRFTLPEQGHIELQRAIIADLDGVQLETIADVIQFRSRLEAIPYDRESILQWKFLEKLGLSAAQHQLPPSPPGVKIEMVQGAAWTKSQLDFTKDTFVDRTSYDKSHRVNAFSPVSQVSLYRSGNLETIDHFSIDSKQVTGIRPSQLFGRTSQLLDRNYQTEPHAGHNFLVAHFNQVQYWVLADEDHDAIWANIVTQKDSGRVISCSLHFYLQPPCETCAFQLPKLILDFRPQSRQVCHVTMYHIDLADFQSPVQPQQLRVPIHAGAVYCDKTSPTEFERRVAKPIDDILGLDPKHVHAMLQAPGGN